MKKIINECFDGFPLTSILSREGRGSGKGNEHRSILSLKGRGNREENKKRSLLPLREKDRMRGAIRISTLLISSIALIAAFSCSRVDGTGPVYNDAGVIIYNGQPLNGKECTNDSQCGTGRFCATWGLCSLECRTSADCALYLAPDAGNDYTCSQCGRCIPIGQTDTECAKSQDKCLYDYDCEVKFGTDYVCGTERKCVHLSTCITDSDCSNVGRGWTCGSDNKCFRRCTRTQDCTLFGWNWKCDLPDGTDEYCNTYPTDPNCVGTVQKISKCIINPGGIDYGNLDPSKPAYKYHGVWGMMLNTAVTNYGLPLVIYQHTVSIQYLLVKITQDGNNIDINQKWCTINLKNFGTAWKDTAWVVTPNRYSDYIFIQHNKNLLEDQVPVMASGAAFDSDRLFEIRGAKLAHPETDPLPTDKNPSGAWDQDVDGNPGMTSISNGTFSGDAYNAQRWWDILSLNVVDENHMMGLVDHGSEQSIIGASNPTLIVQMTTKKYVNSKWSYFMAVRMTDDASCYDVTNMAGPVSDKPPVITWLTWVPEYNPDRKP